MRALGFVAALTIMAPRLLAQATAADSAAIVRLELELTSLLETGQIDRYAEHLTKDYALTADGRLLLRPDALAQWRARGPGIHMTPARIWVRMYGDAAVLTAEVVSEDGGKRSRSRITKLFVRQGHHWRLAALHSSPIGDS